MKTIRVEIDNGIDEDCNLLTRNVFIHDALRVYKDGYSRIKIVPFTALIGKEITIEFDREILYIEGIEI
jgi:hypothetical protein